MSNDPILATFRQNIVVSFNPQQANTARKVLNKAWLGVENCWKRIAGTEQMEPVVDDPVAYEALTKAHHYMNASQHLEIKVHLHKSGKKTIEVA